MKIDKVLNLFNIRSVEKEIFKVCFENDGISATNVAKKLSVNRTSIYDFLDNLIKEGLVIVSQKQSIKFFYAQKLEYIELLIDTKQKEIGGARDAMKEIQKEYYQKNVVSHPKLQIYEGRKELQQMMKDMLLYRDIIIYSFWPIKDIVKILGRDFYQYFQKKRLERNISIKVIWPFEQLNIKKKYEFLNNSLEYKREARVAPRNISFSLGYVIYENKVRFLSSRKENYGFLIESTEMADMMKIQFDVMWANSKPLK